MKLRSLLAVAALATCSAGAAMAADLPVRSAPPAPFYPAPVFTWTGFYAGINAGASFDNKAGSLSSVNFGPAAGFAATGSGPFRGGSSSTGFVGGGQIGYNVQNGMWVYGIEADADYFGQGSAGSRTVADNSVFAGGTATTFRRNGDGFLGTVRGRLGVAAFDRTLLYVTGGLAYGDYGTTYRSLQFTNAAGNNAIQFNSIGNNDDFKIGYAVGAGVEYALTNQISAKAEYLYTDLGTTRYGLYNPGTGAYFTTKSDTTAQIARVGLNYKF